MSDGAIFSYDEYHHDRQYKLLLDFPRYCRHLLRAPLYDAIQGAAGRNDSNRYESNRI